MPWAKAGYAQASEQLPVRAPKNKPTLTSLAEGSRARLITSTDQSKPIIIEGERFSVSFDCIQGTIHSLAYDKQTVIEPGSGPKLSLMRAPCDNDIWAWGIAGERMSTSALPWSALELMMAPHPHELPPAGDTHLHLDASVNGLGGSSCGQGPPLPHCQSHATPQTFSFAIRPYRGKLMPRATQITLNGAACPSSVAPR